MFISKTHLPLSSLPIGLVFMMACGGEDPQGSEAQSVDPVTETPDAGDKTPAPAAGDAEHGAVIAQDQACNSCHAGDYAGTGYYPNITSDEATGIGAWSDQEIADAIAKGVDVNGEQLCLLMPRATLSRSDLADLVAYVRSLPAVDKETLKVCPGR